MPFYRAMSRAQSEIPWIEPIRIQKENEEKQKVLDSLDSQNMNPNTPLERGDDDHDDHDVLDILMGNTQEPPSNPPAVVKEEKLSPPKNTTIALNKQRGARGLKRKRDQMERTNIHSVSPPNGKSEGDESAHHLPPSSGPQSKRHKSMAAQTPLNGIAKTQSISPVSNEKKLNGLNGLQFSPRKLNGSQHNTSCASISTATTNQIHRTLSLMVNRDKKSGNKHLKPLHFKDLSGRRKLKEDNEGEDYYEDDGELLQKQLEVYSERNIEKLQEEVIEMDIVCISFINAHRERMRRMHTG